LCAGSANCAPAATNLSAHAALPPHLLSLLRATRSFNLALQAAPAAPKEDDPLPDGKGKDITKKVCSGCHALSVIADKRRSADEWDAILERMISKGLEASDDDLDKIHDYLVTTLGTATDGSTGAPPASPSPQ
jgi:cytochrome c5